MTKAELNRFRAERTQIRNVFTKVCNTLLELAIAEVFSSTKFEQEFAKAEDIHFILKKKRKGYSK